MAGNTQSEAVQAYIDPIQVAVSCVCGAVLDVSGGHYASNTPHSLALGNGLPQKLRGANVHFSLQQLYRVVRDKDPDRGPWRVTIDQYVYTLWRSSSEAGGASEKPEKLITYQWHPQPKARYNYPHLHLGPAAGIGKAGEAARLSTRSHIPTGRTAIEEVIRFAITQLNVQPVRGDWEKRLDEAQERYERYRSWP